MNQQQSARKLKLIFSRRISSFFCLIAEENYYRRAKTRGAAENRAAFVTEKYGKKSALFQLSSFYGNGQRPSNPWQIGTADTGRLIEENAHMLCRYDPGTGRTSPHMRPEILLLSTGNPRKIHQTGAAAENGRRRNRQNCPNEFI